LSISRFFAYSFTVHIFILAAILFSIPALREKKPGGEIFTHLVSPEEFLTQKQRALPVPEVRSVPRVPRSSFPGVHAPTSSRKESRKIKPERGAFQEPVKVQDSIKAKQNNIPESLATHLSQKGAEGILKGDRGSLSGDRKAVPGGNLPKTGNAGPSLREKLFDKGVINDLAKREIEKEEKEKKDRTFTFDVKEYKFLVYNKRLKERIESIWLYPPDAAAKGIYGDLVIRFTIKKDGRLGAVELVRTSGHKNLDDAAMKALKDAAPYWPLPEEWNMEAYTIEGHFLYTIYGYHIL
jgi:protein TonB